MITEIGTTIRTVPKSGWRASGMTTTETIMRKGMSHSWSEDISHFLLFKKYAI
ncbi:MAG: hypothetical protein ACD_2C00055G0001 [uncultured bacterium (gcode 4)]|uniref:Uncharacterized protein n=1 Tax=uncultured bacterium (gcode 4) TaxID=1234023 RepID=K2H2D8_9BACT|nr:MAG: hypothetical protein ACD_2C00055G0001 [uncultured bacterium (gcode 4)]